MAWELVAARRSSQAMSFYDRRDAGIRLCQTVRDSGERPDLVLALPRGGVVVAAEVARELGLPLDLLLARKIGHPSHREYAIGAVTDDGFTYLNERECAGIDPDWLRGEVDRQIAEAERRRTCYRGDAALRELRGLDVLVVDDGLATGMTMLAALGSIRRRDPSRIVVGVPVAPADTLRTIAALADRAMAVLVPEPFVGAVGAYYRDFSQTSDEEVLAALRSIG